MRQVYLILLAGCSSAAADVPAQQQVPSTRFPQAGCVAPADPRITTLATTATSATAKARTDALAKATLVDLKLAAQRVLVTPKTPAVKAAIVANSTGTFVVGETLVGEDHGATFRFARRGDQVFRIDDAPAITSMTKVVLCGCQMPTCYGSGIAPIEDHTVRQVLYGPLPAGTTYGGVQRLSYQSQVVVTEYANGQCDIECPPIP